MKYNEELRDMFIGQAIKKQLRDVLLSAEDNNRELTRLRKKMAKLSSDLIESRKECDHYYNDLSEYYDKWHNMRLKDWFNVRIVSKFKRSH